MTDCHLLNELVVNVGGNHAGDHTDDKRREDTHHIYHLLPIWINAGVGSGGIGRIITDGFRRFKATKKSSASAMNVED